MAFCISSLPSINSLAIWSRTAPVISPGSPPLFTNGSVYCLLIASSKVVHSSASLEEVLTTWVVLLTCSSFGNLSSIIAKILGNFLTSTFSPSFITVETTLTTGILLSKSNNSTFFVSPGWLLP